MKYVIKVLYETGNSFGRNDTEDILDYNWHNLDIVKQNLQRIKEHYNWYDSKHSWKWGKEEVQKPSWHTASEYSINLLLDNGSEFRICAGWCGYFETLYGARIETEVNTDMYFTID